MPNIPGRGSNSARFRVTIFSSRSAILSRSPQERIMLLTAFTFLHVLISLVGIASGLVFVYGLLTSRRSGLWTSIFLWSTVATSVTGFMFPVHKFLPSHGVGLLSLLILAIAIYALRSRQLAGGWGKTFVITSVVALYF